MVSYNPCLLEERRTMLSSRRFRLALTLSVVLVGAYVLTPRFSAAQSAAKTANAPALVNIKKIYVEPMENHLDQYLTSEISRQFHGSLQLLTDANGAEAILKGVNLGAQNTTKATVNLVDPSGKIVLWSGTAADRENKFLDLKHGGLQTVAAHLVKDLRKSMQPK
jgi:hypothetical protein